MSTAESDRPLHILAALRWMSASALAFSGMAILAKRLAVSIPQFELVFFRSLINFVLVFAVMQARRETFFPARKVLLVFRGVAGFVGVACLFYTIARLPLSIAMMLGWSSPIFVILFSAIFLRERLRSLSFAWIGLAFLGLVLLVQPDFAIGWTALPLGSVAIGLLGAAASGLAYVAVRAATARVGVNAIVLYWVGVSTLISAPLAAMEFRVPSASQALELLILGGLATLGQFTMTQGYRFAPAGLVSTMSLLAAVFSAMFGWLFFDERLAPLQWGGMCLLGLSIVLLTNRVDIE